METVRPVIGCAVDNAAARRLVNLRTWDSGYQEGLAQGRKLGSGITRAQVTAAVCIAMSATALIVHAADVWGALRCGF